MSAQLFHGDCLDVMRGMKDGSVDHTITDPPYSENTHKNSKTNRGVNGSGVKQVTFDSISDTEFISVIDQVIRVTKGWIVATCDYRHAALMYNSPYFIRLGAWVKPNPMPQISADRPAQGFETVLILHAGKVKKVWNRGGGSGVWTCSPVNRANVPTEKPITLYKNFVMDFTQPGDIIFDPFSGSGTSGEASIKLGRSFIGVEKNAQHFAIAKKRIEAAQLQIPMFTAPAPTAEQSPLWT